MRFFIKLIGTQDDQVADWSSEVNIKLLRHISFSKRNKVMDIIKEVEIGDRFVLYCTRHGFMGLQSVTSNYYENAELYGPDWPHIIDVLTYLLIVDFEKAIPISEVKQWPNASKLLSHALKVKLVKGFFEITIEDFKHFQCEIQKRIQI